MIEESVESFMTQYKLYAVPVELLAKVEGSPLLECSVSGKILHLFERTAPYGSRAGKRNVIVNAAVDSVEQSDKTIKTFESIKLSQLKAVGVVLEHQGEALVIDVGIPIVLSSSEAFDEVALGDWISFESQIPLHGFVLPELAKTKQQTDEDSI